MIEMSLQITGAEELRKDFEALPRNIRRRVLVKALRAGARQVLGYAQDAAPVLTGALKRALKVTTAKRSRNSVAYFVYLPRRRDLGIDPADRWYYPGIVVGGHRYAKPRPFVEQSFQRAKGADIEGRILEQIRKFIDLEWRKAS